MYSQLPTFLSLLSFFAFAVYLYLGIYVLRLNAKSTLNRIFSISCLSFGIWAFSYSLVYPAPDVQACWFWYRLSSIGWCCFCGILLHFFMVLTGKKWLLKKWWIYLLLYLPGGIQAYRSLSGVIDGGEFIFRSTGWYRVQATNSSWYYIYYIYMLTFILSGLVITWIWGRKSDSPKEKKQALIIVSSGIAAMVLGTIPTALLPMLNINHMPDISPVTILIWIFAIWYSISKYKFMVLTPEIAAQEIISRVMDLLVPTNPSGEIISINRQTRDLLGFEDSELIGRQVLDIVVEADHLRVEIEKVKEAAKESVRKTVKETTFSQRNLDLTYKTKDDGTIPVSVSISTIIDDKNGIIGIVVVAQDMRQARQLQEEIRERKQIEATLWQSYEKLKELDKLKTDFLSTVSHELRTPLTSVLGFAQIIKKRLDEVILPTILLDDKKVSKAVGQVKNNIDIIVSEGQRLTALINEVLDLAKMEAGKTEWRMETISIREIIETASASTSSLFEQNQLDIIFDIEDNLPIIVGDRGRLIQVLINLISNAVKFTDEGSITFKVRLNSGIVTISVIDTGIGIAHEDCEKVFEKFKQIGDTLTEKPKGTGLGLPICRQIVEYHGGRIWAESCVGKGSCFSFCIPVIK